MSSSVAASLPSSTEKASNHCGQSFEHLDADFFDQFLTFDNTADHASPDYSILPATFDDCDEFMSVTTPTSCLDDILNLSTQVEDVPTMHAAASCPADLSSQFYAEISGRATVSDPELLSLSSITLESPQLPANSQTSPSSPENDAPQSQRRRSKIVDSLSRTFKKTAASIDKNIFRSPIRKASTPGKIHTTRSNRSQQDLWGRKLSQDPAKLDFDFDFNFDIDVDISNNGLPMSPPPSGKVSDASEHSNAIPERQITTSGFPYNITMPQPQTPGLGYDTPLATPLLEQHHTPRTMFRGAPADSSPFPVTPRNKHPSGSWTRIPSGGYSQYSPNQNSYPMSEMDDSLWCNHAATTSIAHPSPSGLRSNSHNTSKTLAMQLQNGLSFSSNDLSFDPLDLTGGLMIQMPDIPTHPMMIAGSPSAQISQGYFASTSGSGHHRGVSQSRHAHMPPLRHRASAEQQSRRYLSRPRPNHPRSHSHSHPHSRSVSESHHSTPSRSSRRAHPHNHNAYPPSSDSDTPPSPSPTLHIRKRRSPKSSSSKTGSKTSSSSSSSSGSGSGSAGIVDFVNYTPDDSRKILTGVAPSGSSKTKARREAEQREKRRKLSQAAVRAVRDAGGDVEMLREQGLLI